jgi:hypothetical protein
MNWVPKPAPAQHLPAFEPIRAVEASPALVDEFLESYVFWRESCEAVSAAYDSWVKCEPARRGSAFESYCTALDGEERAAQVYSDRAGRIRAARG